VKKDGKRRVIEISSLEGEQSEEDDDSEGERGSIEKY